MVRIISSLAFVVCGWCVVAAAQANPILVYSFKTTDIACNPVTLREICSPQAIALEQESLDAMYIGLSPSALTNGSATLSIQHYGRGSTSPTVNSGVEQMSIYLYRYGPYTQVLPDGFVRPIEEGSYLVAALSLAVGQYLSGAISVNNSASDISMGTPLGQTEWQGRYNSDALNQNISFTGNWLFSKVVPEPGTLALLLAALGGTALTTRRRTRW